MRITPIVDGTAGRAAMLWDAGTACIGVALALTVAVSVMPNTLIALLFWFFLG